MKLLLVGASGFIGKNLLARLAGSEHEIVATYNDNAGFLPFAGRLKGRVTTQRCDLRKEDDVKELMRLGEFEKAIYLASDTRVGYLVVNPSADVSNNILPVANFLKHYAGGAVVFFSSGAVYMGQRGSVSHSDVRPTIPYAVSKYASELYIEHAARTKGFGYVIIRFFGAYGPYEPERKITRKLLQAIGASPTGEIPFTVYGDGKNLIDVIHVDDAVRAIVSVLQSNKKNLTLDLCGDAHLSVNRYVEKVAAVFDREVALLHEGASAEYIEFYASNEEFRNQFNFSPSTTLEDGLRRYMAWLRMSDATARV